MPKVNKRTLEAAQRHLDNAERAIKHLDDLVAQHPNKPKLKNYQQNAWRSFAKVVERFEMLTSGTLEGPKPVTRIWNVTRAIQANVSDATQYLHTGKTWRQRNREELAKYRKAQQERA